jgi:hypothetical protein
MTNDKLAASHPSIDHGKNSEGSEYAATGYLCGCVSQPFDVISVELTSYALSLGKFDAPDQHNSEVMKGQKIAVGSCVSCHNNGSAGGKMAQRPWQVLAAHAVYNSDYFRQYVVDPQKFKPNVGKPALVNSTFSAMTSQSTTSRSPRSVRKQQKNV